MGGRIRRAPAHAGLLVASALLLASELAVRAAAIQSRSLSQFDASQFQQGAKSKVQDAQVGRQETPSSLTSTLTSKRKLQSSEGGCTAKTQWAKDYTANYQTYCNNYGFYEQGNPLLGPACVTAREQYMTDREKYCAGFSPDKTACMGPLAQLIGWWEGSSGKSYTALPAYGVGAPNSALPTETGLATPPGQPSSSFHSIKNQTYKEVIVFEPIYGDVKNRGYSMADPINARCQSNQHLQGLSYKLAVYQTSPSDEDGEYGGLLHEEMGMVLYNVVPGDIDARNGGEDDFEVVRLATIPHGVAVASEGNIRASTGHGAEHAADLLSAQEDADLSIIPKTEDGEPLKCMPGEVSYTTAEQPWGSTADEDGNINGTQAGTYPYLTLNPFLVNETLLTLETAELMSVEQLSFSNKVMSQTSFINKQAKTINFDSKFWISNYQSTTADGGNSTFAELQYYQKVDLVFQARFDCISCAGGNNLPTSDNPDGCYMECDGLENVIYTGNMTLDNGTVTQVQPPSNFVPQIVPGDNFNEIIQMQHRQCYDCKLKDEREQYDCDKPLIAWPHIQVNTLRKQSSDYHEGYRVLSELATGNDDGY